MPTKSSGTSFFATKMNFAPLTMPDFDALSRNCLSKNDLSSCLRIRIESGEFVQLRDNYLAQIWNFIKQEGDVDTQWMRCGINEVFFLSQSGVKLVLQKTTDATMSSTSTENVTGDQETFHLLLDQSGSMSNVQTAAYDGARELLESLSSETTVVFSTFASSVSTGEPLQKEEVIQYLSRTRIASGATALYDAIIQTVTASADTPGKITVVIVTDGQDTCSRGTLNDAKRLLENFQQNVLHNVVFLGSHQDALQSASVLGIPVTHALSFGVEANHMRSAFHSASNMVSRMITGDNSGFLPVERAHSIQT